ncbi:metal ABC transporter ATP-binding protein [Halopseudomonas sp.]|uniref:metal ABC transporter ATP-binding protein n=1 Tax=Halopseudomonas sp. TaxID=2901191 RepID=UPI003002AA9A
MINCQDMQWGPPGRPLTPPLSLQLRAGSLTAVLGANGSGKSSLLKVLAGLVRPLSGRCQVTGRKPGQIGYLPQVQTLDRQFPIDCQTLVNDGQWRNRGSRAERRKRLQDVLLEWQLVDQAYRPLAALSGGELQRALLARLSLQEADLLLLDEPTSAMDAAGQELFWGAVARWQAQGRSLVLVCHDLPRVAARVQHILHISAEGCRYQAPARLALAEPVSCAA